MRVGIAKAQKWTFAEVDATSCRDLVMLWESWGDE